MIFRRHVEGVPCDLLQHMIWSCPGKIVRPFLSAYKTPFTLGVIDLLPDSALLRLDLLQRRLEKTELCWGKPLRTAVQAA